MSDDQKLYSTKQAAKFLGVSVRTLKYWRKSGKLVPEKCNPRTGEKFYSEIQLIGVQKYFRGATFEIQGCKIRSQGVQNSETGDKERVTNTEPKTAPTAQSATLDDSNRASEETVPQNEQQTAAKTGNETAESAATVKNCGKRQMVPQPIVTRLLNSGSTSEVETADEETSPGVEVEEFYFDDDDIIVINDSFKATLPEEYRQNLTKLFNKLTVAPFGEIFSTPFNNEKTLITYAKLDYVNSGVTFDRKFDETHELILNSLYSFYRAENILFTSRNILQHIFGNVADHFQSELVEIIEQHLDELICMRISMDLKDKFGNNAHIKIHGEKYRPVELEESLLDVSILKMKSAKNSKVVKVYRINRLSPIFKYAEKLKQITSWQTEYMKVPVRKTMQNALLCNYLLTKISLVKNSKNKYKNNGILFTTIHEDLKLDVSDRHKVKNIRDNVRKMFDYWIKIGLIKSYRFEKKGTAFYKISFTVASGNIKGGKSN